MDTYHLCDSEYRFMQVVWAAAPVGSGRLVELTTKVVDKPGSLLQMLQLVSQSGANILTINHAREDQNSEVGACIVSMVLETRDANHIEAIRQSLTAGGYPLLDT